MKLVKEEINFQRGISPKKSIGVGKAELIKTWIDSLDRFTEYSINSDLSIDVHESVYLNNNDLVDLSMGFPNYIKFNIIEGNFDIDDTNIPSLFGCPLEVHGYFSCQMNPIESLEFIPSIIYGDCYIHNNKQLFTEGQIDKASDVKGHIETDDSDED